MKRYLNSASVAVLVGLVLGVAAAATVIETEPPILGWLFGVGMGLMGGALVAAIASGNALVSGPSGSRKRGGQSAAPWLEPPASKNGTRE